MLSSVVTNHKTAPRKTMMKSTASFISIGVLCIFAVKLTNGQRFFPLSCKYSKIIYRKLWLFKLISVSRTGKSPISIKEKNRSIRSMVVLTVCELNETIRCNCMSLMHYSVVCVKYVRKQSCMQSNVLYMSVWRMKDSPLQLCKNTVQVNSACRYKKTR